MYAHLQNTHRLSGRIVLKGPKTVHLVHYAKHQLVKNRYNELSVALGHVRAQPAIDALYYVAASSRALSSLLA